MTRYRDDTQPVGGQCPGTQAADDQPARAIEALWEVAAGAPAVEQLETRITLVEASEVTHDPSNLPVACEAIRFQMEQERVRVQSDDRNMTAFCYQKSLMRIAR